MSFTAENVATLKAAIAAGTLEVRMGDRTIRYQSTESMLAALDRMEAEVAAESRTESCRRATRRFTFATMRGD